MKRIMKFIKRPWEFNLLKASVLLVLLTLNGLMLPAQEEVSPSKVFKKHNAAVKAVAFSKDGKTLATGGDDKMVYLWDIQSGEMTGSIENHFAVKALQFTENDDILAACGSDIKLMDKSGKLIRTFSGYTTDIWSFGYHGATRRITAGSYSKTIRVWDFDTGKLLLNLEGHEKSCLPVSFNTTGNLIASGSLDKSVRLWDAASGKQEKQHELHSGNVFAVVFHPSGRYLASASADKTIRLWNVETGSIVKTYSGHKGAVFDIRFSPDGYHLISCSADQTIILWEVATGTRLFTFTGHAGIVNSVRFSADGKYIASASDDQTIRLWPVESRYFVESFYRQEIGKAINSSPLFAPRSSDETKQAYAEREKQAEHFLNNLYEDFHKKYIERISQLSPDD